VLKEESTVADVKSVLQVFLGMWLVLGRPIAGFVLLFGLTEIAFQTFNLPFRNVLHRKRMRGLNLKTATVRSIDHDMLADKREAASPIWSTSLAFEDERGSGSAASRKNQRVRLPRADVADPGPAAELILVARIIGQTSRTPSSWVAESKPKILVCLVGVAQEDGDKRI
jgi:hypothetical protein